MLGFMMFRPGGPQLAPSVSRSRPGPGALPDRLPMSTYCVPGAGAASRGNSACPPGDWEEDGQQLTGGQ